LTWSDRRSSTRFDGKPDKVAGKRTLPCWKSMEIWIGGRGFSCISNDGL
jgi:hypothetical protein